MQVKTTWIIFIDNVPGTLYLTVGGDFYIDHPKIANKLKRIPDTQAQSLLLD